MEVHRTGETCLIITSLHAKQATIQTALINLAGFLRTLKAAAEPWAYAKRLQACTPVSLPTG